MKRRGRYCWKCGRRRANELFSGRGHARCICRDCEKGRRAAVRTESERPGRKGRAPLVAETDPFYGCGRVPKVFNGTHVYRSCEGDRQAALLPSERARREALEKAHPFAKDVPTEKKLGPDGEEKNARKTA